MSDKTKGEMSFLEHLEELRWHIVRSLIAITLLAIVAFVYKKIIFDVILLGPKDPDFFTNRTLCKIGESINFKNMCINSVPFPLKSIKMTSQFMSHIKISLISGLVVSSPYIFYEFWKFVKPALYQKERKHARGAVFYITFLFLCGLFFGYFIIAPLSVNFLGNYRVSTQIENEITLTSYFSIVAAIPLASGLLFELPAIIYFLSKVGIVTPKFLKKYRKHALVIVLIISAIITPPDIFSQILVAVPLLFLYEISISLSKRIQKRQEEKLAG